MKLSIIICTFNRAVQLEQLLEDLVYQHSRLNADDASAVEIVLVDNNSFDNTKEIVYKYTESTVLPVRYYVEKKQGVANAKNHGIQQANGEMLAFLDDDLTMDEDWLKETMELARFAQDREIGVYGGRTVPLWQERVPKWLNSAPPHGIEQELFTGHSYGDEEAFYPLVSDIGAARFPIGTNVMYRREIFENCGDFRTDLGRNVAGGMGLHEDYEFHEYLSTLQVPMLYVPQCTAFHPITAEQMDKYAMRRWYLKSGRSKYWMVHTDRMKRRPDPLYAVHKKYRSFFPKFMANLKLFSTPLYLYAKAGVLFMYWLLSHLFFDRKKTFWLSLQFSKTIGEIEAAVLVDQKTVSKKFSFKDRIQEQEMPTY